MQKRQERDNVLVCVCPDIAAFDGFCILIWSEASCDSDARVYVCKCACVGELLVCNQKTALTLMRAAFFQAVRVVSVCVLPSRLGQAGGQVDGAFRHG